MNDKAKAATKTEVYAALAERTGLAKKDVAAVMDGLSDFIKGQVGNKGPGLFVLPGLLKVKRQNKPAAPPRMGINPKTKEPMQIPAKPPRTVVKVLALKALKETVK